MKKNIILCLFLVLFSTYLPAALDQDTKYIIAKSGLSLRAKPSTSAKKIAVIPYGKKIKLVQTLNHNQLTVEGIKAPWCKVRYNNKTGYVFGGFISSYPSPRLAPVKGDWPFLSYIKKTFKATGKIKEYPYKDEMWSYSTKIQNYEHGIITLENAGRGDYSSMKAYLPQTTIAEAFLLFKLSGLNSDSEYKNLRFPQTKQGQNQINLTFGQSSLQIKKHKQGTMLYFIPYGDDLTIVKDIE